jgi:hypothetical protein
LHLQKNNYIIRVLIACLQEAYMYKK